MAKSITGHSTDRMREHYSTVRTVDLQKAGRAVGSLIGPLRLLQGGKADEESTEESTAYDGTKTAGRG